MPSKGKTRGRGVPSPSQDRDVNRFAPLADLSDAEDGTVAPAQPVLPEEQHCPPNQSEPTETQASSPRADVPTSVLPEDRIIICSSPDHAADIRKVGPAARAAAIRELVGDIESLRVLASGDLRIVTKSLEQARALAALNSFLGFPASFRPPRPRQPRVYGVIRGIPLEVESSDLDAAFSAAGAISSLRLRRRNEEGLRCDSTSFRLCFQNSLPSHITIGYERFPVRAYVFQPLQCYSCYRYGHEAKHCKSAARCGRCGKDHPTSDCSESTTCCPLCQQPHPAWDKQCPFRISAQSTQRTCAPGFSYAEALKRGPASSPPTILPRHLQRDQSCQTMDLKSPTRKCDASTQTEPPPSSDAQEQTIPVLTLRRPPKSVLFTEEETGKEQTAVLPLTALHNYTLKVLQMLDANRDREGKQLTVGELVQLVLDYFFPGETTLPGETSSDSSEEDDSAEDDG